MAPKCGSEISKRMMKGSTGSSDETEGCGGQDWGSSISLSSKNMKIYVFQCFENADRHAQVQSKSIRIYFPTSQRRRGTHNPSAHCKWHTQGKAQPPSPQCKLAQAQALLTQGSTRAYEPRWPGSSPQCGGALPQTLTAKNH